MSRRHSAIKREIRPDAKYNSVILAKFINSIMIEGKKAKAEKIVYDALSRLEKKHGINPFDAFKEAMNNLKPYVEVKSVRVGGANYQVPSSVDEKRGGALATRWLIGAAEKRSGRSMVEKLADEILDALNKRGSAFKKREEVHKMAESNKAFSHLNQRTQ